MLLREANSQIVTTENQHKWFNSPVKIHEGTLKEIRSYIPAFERRGFGFNHGASENARLNERLDTIVRLPIGEDRTVIPVGVVSKDYLLVQHITVLDEAKKALDIANIASSEVKAELKMAEYGERMALSLFLPEKYSFDPGDGHSMALRLECLNSVDGSTRFQALMGWFRVVCSNGLVIGVTRSAMRRRHVGNFHIEDIGDVLRSGLTESEKEKKNLTKWQKVRVSINQLIPWADKTIRKEWGFKAAARAFHIARTGIDVKIRGQYWGNRPTAIDVQATNKVPGTPSEARSLFDVSQVLAWLAKDRRDIQEQMEWRRQIPDLLRLLK